MPPTKIVDGTHTQVSTSIGFPPGQIQGLCPGIQLIIYSALDGPDTIFSRFEFSMESGVGLG